MITNIIFIYLTKKGVHNTETLNTPKKNIGYFLLRNNFCTTFLNKMISPFWDNFNVLCSLDTKKERENA